MAKKSKAIGGAVAFLLAGVVAVGTIGYGTSGFKDWSFSKFTGAGDIETGTVETTATESGDSDNAVITETISSGINMASTKIERSAFAANAISDTAESAYTVTATIDNADEAFDTGISLSVEFTDSSSSWASGKTATDYVSISTDHIDSGESFTVSCNEAFGEQIQIVATADGSLSGSPVSASVSVDYYKRVTGVSLSFYNTEYTSVTLYTTYGDYEPDTTCCVVSQDVGSDWEPYYYYMGSENSVIDAVGGDDSGSYYFEGAFSGSWVNIPDYGSLSWSGSVITLNAYDYFDCGIYQNGGEDFDAVVLFKRFNYTAIDGTSTATVSSMSDNFIDGFKVNLTYGIGTCYEAQSVSVTLPNAGITCYLAIGKGFSGTTTSSPITWSSLCSSSFGYTSGAEQTLYNTLKTAYDSGTAWNFTVETVGATSGATYSNSSLGLLIDPSALYVYASGVSVSASGVAF